MDNNTLILLASGFIIISHIFIWISNKTKVPSVLLLMGLGVFFHTLFGDNLGHLDDEINVLLQLLGSLGLIFIVLEGSLDLKNKYRKQKLTIMELFIL